MGLSFHAEPEGLGRSTRQFPVLITSSLFSTNEVGAARSIRGYDRLRATPRPRLRPVAPSRPVASIARTGEECLRGYRLSVASRRISAASDGRADATTVLLTASFSATDRLTVQAVAPDVRQKSLRASRKCGFEN